MGRRAGTRAPARQCLRLRLGRLSYGRTSAYGMGAADRLLQVVHALQKRLVRFCGDAVEGGLISVQDSHGASVARRDGSHRVALQFRNACDRISQNRMCHVKLEPH